MGKFKEAVGKVKGRAVLLGSASMLALPSVAFAAEGDSGIDVASIMSAGMGTISSDFGKALLVIVPIAFSIYAGPKVIRLVMRVFNSLTGKGA
ncbi:hypothetical protein [Anaerotignum propionicum]|uniref:hypothetical protein n=1 Tax=Anaerotignum propionicum TaxID=28446 RepID=UPI0028A15D84|nr:hypothetical protein [Anaerotignum propionicum]